MITYDTKTEILKTLDKMTRDLNLCNIDNFTTAKIASECHVSRSLASQYLNELVRQGDVIKVNARPVLYFHRHSVERYFRHAFDKSEYASIDELLGAAGIDEEEDFDKAIGFDLTYGTCVDHLKSAIRYPPHGLPALLIGEPGTGKRMMSELTFEYGVNAGILPTQARYVRIDCKRPVEATEVEYEIFGADGFGGAVKEANGGVIYLSGYDHLPRVARERILQRIGAGDPTGETARGTSDVPPARFLLSSALPADSDIVKGIARFVPITVTLPRLAERSVEERTLFVMHYLRVEGRRVGADIAVSRGALRALVDADFKDNIDGLRSCITNCCASAYLNRESETLTIQTYNLPSSVLGKTAPEPDDDQLVSGDKDVNDPSVRVTGFFQKVVDPVEALERGQVSFTEFFTSATMAVRAYDDYMNFDFENKSVNPRVGAYEKMVAPVIEQVNHAYGIELTRKISRSIAQSLFTQLWGGAGLSKWRIANADAVERTLTLLEKNQPGTATVVEEIAAKTKTALGMELDALSRTVLFIEVGDALRATGGPRDYLGVVVCHGYSTATSIADAADRILRTHVFEAIDMTYDREVTEIVGQLSRLLARYSHCKTVAILVDMGSLEKINDAITGLTTCDIHIVNNVSTGLALEVGSALIAHADLDEVLAHASAGLAPSYSVVRGSVENDAVAFCSESGIEAADKIRQIVQNSLPGTPEVQLVTCDYPMLAQKGDGAPVFSDYRVRAVVGTMDPGIVSVPFVGLEDILYEGSSDALDRALFPLVDPESVQEFHANLLRNLTLRNVIESITILNPEMLYIEADRAVKRLAELQGEDIDARRKIGVYVHLCGLIERLVTKNFVDSAPDTEAFERDHADFIENFREAFIDMTRRYRVEIPVSEIAYVHHMLHVSMADAQKKVEIAGMILEDE